MEKILIKNNKMKWLFGGVGFHNSEATMTPLMSDKFKNEIALKTFSEISPTYSRVFAGYADWSKEAMDAFADYYDKTFRKAGTLLYVVPGRLPYITEDFDIDDYCEKVAKNLEYLIKERNCNKIRYYCVTNELSVGNTYSYFSEHLDLFKTFHEKLYMAFKRHGIDVGLIATDCSGTERFHQIGWAAENMDEITENYCVHLYSHFVPGDLDSYQKYVDAFTPQVMVARSKEKRLILGEFGQMMQMHPNIYPMVNDMCYPEDAPKTEGVHAISVCEEAMAAINAGCFCAVYWTMVDYPDPFIKENGDTPEEKAKYDAARFSGHGIDKRYNKHGLIRWCDAEENYTSRASLYTMGYMAKLFKKGTRVLTTAWEDDALRASAVVSDTGAVSIAIINWSDEDKEISLELEGLKGNKPYRVYEYSANNIPYNKFNDLQAHSREVDLSSENESSIIIKGVSVTFLTTDYEDRIPSKIKGIKSCKGMLKWKKCNDLEHRYYRVFASDEKNFPLSYENQIASTVAEYYVPEKEYKYYRIVSVDAYGNAGK